MPEADEVWMGWRLASRMVAAPEKEALQRPLTREGGTVVWNESCASLLSSKDDPLYRTRISNIAVRRMDVVWNESFCS